MVALHAAPRNSSATPPPRRVGRYDLLTELGRGGMASVYLARSLGSAGFERLAAVKLLHRGLCADPDFVEMFLDEARVAARLHHPNATAITDVGAEGPQLYMVMDYVEGDTLHAVQCAAVGLRRAVPLGIALRIVLDALAGLDAAHELKGADGSSLGLIHRDVTPQNVLIGVDGAARLVDFGIARAACRTGITTVGVLKGKLPFMAPEQIRGRGVDRRADVFAMGVTLWETIALRRCFPSREGSMLSRLANEAYRPLQDLAPHSHPALDDICRRALAFDPADRFSSAAEFAEAIERVFRAELATQRELGQFMSVVAAGKLKAEREAVRLSSAPVPARSLRPVTQTRPVQGLDLRPPRLPDFGDPPRASSSVAPPPRAGATSMRQRLAHIDDALTSSEDVTAIAPSVQPPSVAPVQARRPMTLPPLPRLPTPPRGRASIAPRGGDDSLYEVPTQAFTLERGRPSMVPPPPVSSTEAKAAAPFFPERAPEAKPAAVAPAVPAPPPPPSPKPIEAVAAAADIEVANDAELELELVLEPEPSAKGQPPIADATDDLDAGEELTLAPAAEDPPAPPGAEPVEASSNATDVPALELPSLEAPSTPSAALVVASAPRSGLRALLSRLWARLFGATASP
jgi:eukaryotic-like serine/threonine-protein kinase